MLSQVPVASRAVHSSKVVAFPRSAAPVPVNLGAERLVRPARPTLVEAGRGNSRALPVLAPAAALAHDARNALTTLIMIAGLLGEPGVPAGTQQHYAADIERVAQALGSLIERLADSGRGITVASPDVSIRTGASQTVEQCAGILKAVAGPVVQVYVSAESQLPPLALGADALERVLVNLVKNAGEAMPGGGVVRVTARRALSRSAPAVLVHVSDNGPGIAPLALSRIFEPGFSSKRSRQSAAESCGLGLAIVRELVEAAGGAIEVASTRRRGTTFELRLPCLALEPKREAQRGTLP